MRKCWLQLVNLWPQWQCTTSKMIIGIVTSKQQRRYPPRRRKVQPPYATQYLFVKLHSAIAIEQWQILVHCKHFVESYKVVWFHIITKGHITQKLNHWNRRRIIWHGELLSNHELNFRCELGWLHAPLQFEANSLHFVRFLVMFPGGGCWQPFCETCREEPPSPSTTCSIVSTTSSTTWKLCD